MNFLKTSNGAWVSNRTDIVGNFVSNGENLEKNKLLYARLANLASKHSCTPPQLAPAWLLHQGDDIIPIPGILDS
jgi:aryl-alcohol dehydrogenase-like predicted oxidoreductase